MISLFSDPGEVLTLRSDATFSRSSLLSLESSVMVYMRCCLDEFTLDPSAYSDTMVGDLTCSPEVLSHSDTPDRGLEASIRQSLSVARRYGERREPEDGVKGNDE